MINMSDSVLAKSCRNAGQPLFHETLAGHSAMVAESFSVLFGGANCPSRLGQCWLRFFKVSPDRWEQFHRNGLTAACLHDTGKANSSFQAAVRRPGTAQALRHEHLSGIILNSRGISDWLSGFCNADTVIASVVGHHLRFTFDNFCQRGLLDGFTTTPAAVAALLQDAAAAVGVTPPQEACVIPEVWSFDGRAGSENLTNRAAEMKSRLYRFGKGLKQNESEARLLRAVRSALLLADSAGSAIPREGMALEQWIEDVFSPEHVLTEEEINTLVIGPRIRQISAKGAFQWSSFQDAAEGLSDRSLLMTPCGSGKTLAAWRWIASRLRSHSASRVIFLYPTRGTAAEGFRDYVSWAPESDAALITGTSRFDLEGMFQNPADDRTRRDYLVAERLYALGYWPRRIFSATVDQFLGFMQNSYASVCLLPLLADSILVFDEVHSFDKGLFGALKGFLAEFDLPVLCMTASLPAGRTADLQELGLQAFPDDEDTGCFSDLDERSRKPRYHVDSVPGEDAALDRAREALHRGQRVLWVVNTTERCRRLARQLGALCYHSRYRLVDRKDRHEAVVRAFQQREKPACAVTTQVCEMSLDLDADVLISEYAPVTALIQRMGRCNRHDYPGENRLGAVLLYSPESGLPYSESDLTGVPDFVNDLAGEDASQADLQALLERYGPGEVEVERWLAFIQGGVTASSREESLRDANDHTVSAILAVDVEDYLRMRREGNPGAEGLVLPVPRRESSTDPRLPGYLGVAAAERYDTMLGYGKNQ